MEHGGRQGGTGMERGGGLFLAVYRDWSTWFTGTMPTPLRRVGSRDEGGGMASVYD